VAPAGIVRFLGRRTAGTTRAAAPAIRAGGLADRGIAGPIADAATARIRVAAPAERRAPGPAAFTAAAGTQAAAPRVGVG